MKSAPSHSPSFRAAMMYMTGSVTLQTCADRYRISKATVHTALHRYRAAQRDIWPEDDVSC